MNASVNRHLPGKTARDQGAHSQSPNPLEPPVGLPSDMTALTGSPSELSAPAYRKPVARGTTPKEETKACQRRELYEAGSSAVRVSPGDSSDSPPYVQHKTPELLGRWGKRLRQIFGLIQTVGFRLGFHTHASGLPPRSDQDPSPSPANTHPRIRFKIADARGVGEEFLEPVSREPAQSETEHLLSLARKFDDLANGWEEEAYATAQIAEREIALGRAAAWRHAGAFLRDHADATRRQASHGVAP